MSESSDRMVRVEVEVRDLKSTLKEHKDETRDKFEEVNDKLDDLLALRNKGAGVFWLVSALMGIGLLSGMVQFLKWLVGAH